MSIGVIELLYSLRMVMVGFPLGPYSLKFLASFTVFVFPYHGMALKSNQK